MLRPPGLIGVAAVAIVDDDDRKILNYQFADRFWS
jgi:hypothetical protein